MSIGNLKHGYLYYPIPKSGSTTVILTLEKYYGGEAFDPGKKIPDRYNMAMPPGYEDVFKFTVCRNPYERAVSVWWHLVFTLKDRYGYVKQVGPRLHNFIFFLKWLKGKHNQLNRIAWDAHKYVRNVDRVIKLCDLHTEFKQLPFYTGEPADVPVLNKSGHDMTSKYLTGEAKRLIYEIYREDFERFGYVR